MLPSSASLLGRRLHRFHTLRRLDLRFAVLEHQLRFGHSLDARFDLFQRIFDVLTSQSGELHHLIGCVLEIESLVEHTTENGWEDK